MSEPVKSTNEVREPVETPLCPVHKRVDELGTLEMPIGGLNCVACTLQERVELLNLLAPFADGAKDSVTVLREVTEFYATHRGPDRVVVSYPAITSPRISPEDAARVIAERVSREFQGCVRAPNTERLASIILAVLRGEE